MPTRKTFQMVADIIRAELGNTPEGRRMAEAFADEFARQNPRFDRARFLTACGL